MQKIRVGDFGTYRDGIFSKLGSIHGEFLKQHSDEPHYTDGLFLISISELKKKTLETAAGVAVTAHSVPIEFRGGFQIDTSKFGSTFLIMKDATVYGIKDLAEFLLKAVDEAVIRLNPAHFNASDIVIITSVFNANTGFMISKSSSSCSGSLFLTVRTPEVLPVGIMVHGAFAYKNEIIGASVIPLDESTTMFSAYRFNKKGVPRSAIEDSVSPIVNPLPNIDRLLENGTYIPFDHTDKNTKYLHF